MVKNTYSDDLQRIFKAQTLPSSPLIREEKNLFTFSPIQDELEYFKEKKDGLYVKEQVCFRNVYPANLVNPISTPCQTLISLFSFREEKYGQIIETFITKFLNKWIPFDNIYIICPKMTDILGQLYKVTNHIIEIDKNRLQCHVPLSGNHYYIKICSKYHDGLVTLANFVLINFQGGFQSQLDSVFFPLRLDMIREQAKSIYESQTFLATYNRLYRLSNSHELAHFFISQLEALNFLFPEIGKFGNHRHSYALKKVAREIFLECDIHNISVELIFNEFPSVKIELLKQYKEYSRNINKALKKVKKNRDTMGADYTYQTLGIPYKLYKSQIDPTYKLPELPSNFAYYRDSHKNLYQNPIESYK